MVRINFVAEDTLRDIVFRSVNGYSAMITRFCPDSVCGEFYEYRLVLVFFNHHFQSISSHFCA